MPTRRSRIIRLIDYWEPTLRRAFLQAVGRMRSAAQLNTVVRMLEAGRIQDAIRAVGISAVQLRPLEQALSQAFEAGGTATAAIVPTVVSGGLRLSFQFNVRNPAAEDWLRTYSSTMVREIVDDQRTMIRDFLRTGMERGQNPRKVALDLVGRISRTTGQREGGVIGLTSSQGEWVRNYMDELASDNPLVALERRLRDRRFDGLVRRAAASEEPLTIEQIETMARAYTNRALRYRAEMIARTEAIHSLHEAQQQSMEQAIAAGLDPNNVHFIWRTAQDNRVRDAHEVMDGQQVGMGELFVDGDGNELEFPGDPSAPPETTINCFPGDTLVCSSKLNVAYRRWYEGPLVEIISATGRRLAGTPNHPIMTTDGWVNLGELREFHNLVCTSPVKSFTFTNPYINNMPICIEQIFDTLAQSGDCVRTAGTPMDFHSDGAYRNVDVVFAAGLLTAYGRTSFYEPINEFALESTDYSTSSSRSGKKPTRGSFFSADRSMSSADLLGSLGGRHMTPSERFRLATATYMDVMLGKDSPKHPCSDAELRCSGFARAAADIMRNTFSGDLVAYMTELFNGPRPLITSDRVARIKNSRFSGHVFNLETNNGYYTANGIFVHNCRCWRETDVDFLAGIE